MRSNTLTRHLPAAVGVAAVGLFAASPAIAGADHGRGEGALVVYRQLDRPWLDVPAGATAKVTAVYDAAGKSTVTLHVKGLKPDTEYGAHAHVFSCGSKGTDAGPHFQFELAPPGRSTDPAWANPQNEIWLDLTTNAAGNGLGRTVVPSQFTPDLRPQSVVIHELHTSTGGEVPAGTAGARLACLDVDF